MSLTGIAALIAAVSFAVLALTAVYVAVRLTGVLGAATALVRDTRTGQETLLARAHAAVDRASAHLDRTEAVSASMDELGTGMEELAGQVNALAGFGKTMAGAVVTGPVGKAAAVAYGVRHAVGLRRGSRHRTLPGEVVRHAGEIGNGGQARVTVQENRGAKR
ncbi:MAG TPA: DUF948 domain-containing protein [Trebonia sp.]|jgi:hypothetical protein|nr:DUF948 domain-containing protein [Trebonia sp.]